MDNKDLDVISVSEIEQVLFDNADLLLHGKGKITEAAKDGILGGLTLTLMTPFAPFIGGAMGVMASDGLGVGSKIVLTAFGAIAFTVVTPVVGVASLVKGVLAAPVALVAEAPRFLFSKKYRQQVKLSKDLQKLKHFYDKCIKNEVKNNPFTEYFDAKFRSTDLRALLCEIEMLNNELGRSRPAEALEVFEYAPHGQTTENKDSDIDEIFYVEEKSHENDDSKDL